MDDKILTALVGLAGALIGSLSSIVTMHFQTKIADRRERIRQATALALEEYKYQLAHRKEFPSIMPLSLFIRSELALLQAIEENDYTPGRLRKIWADNAKIAAVITESAQENERPHRTRSADDA